jgi:hypothetical protein
MLNLGRGYIVYMRVNMNGRACRLSGCWCILRREFGLSTIWVPEDFNDAGRNSMDNVRVLYWVYGLTLSNGRRRNGRPARITSSPTYKHARVPRSGLHRQTRGAILRRIRRNRDWRGRIHSRIRIPVCFLQSNSFPITQAEENAED